MVRHYGRAAERAAWADQPVMASATSSPTGSARTQRSKSCSPSAASAAREMVMPSRRASRAKAAICGFGIQGYALAIDGIAAMSGNKGKR